MASSPSRQTPTITTANQDYKKKEEEEAFSQAMELVYGSVLPMTIHAAMELGVFDILGNVGPDATLSAEQIVTQMPTTNPDAPAMIDRICSLLVQHGVLGVSVGDHVRKLPLRRNYCLSSVSKSQLKNAVLEGGLPFNRVHGTHAYEYAGRDGRFSQVSNTGMKMLESYKGFQNLKQLVVVGGVKHVAGDMFESIPKGDAILLMGILHDWSDDCCLKLLENCYNSLPNDGKVIVVEQILPIYPEISTFARSKSLLDMLLMTQKPG
ncbi:hypothetical protein ACB092_06G268700 [Castanea dentata]